MPASKNHHTSGIDGMECDGERLQLLRHVKHYELVEALAVPHRATSAYGALLDLGMSGCLLFGLACSATIVMSASIVVGI